jgi:hypothetical protein
MKMKTTIFISFALLIVLSCCRISNKPIKKAEILKAYREAPLGWVYLNIYEDSSFNFVLSGIRSKDAKSYAGKVKIIHDSLFFFYDDSVPKAGDIAIIKNDMIFYSNGEYGEILKIGLNNISK